MPQTVTFTGGGDTSMSFTFTAAHDTLDDDGESVRLNFGSTLPAGVTAGTPNTTTVTITDDDDPSVTVRFGAASYTVAESDDTGTAEVTENTVEVTVTLSADPERTVVIPIEATNLNGATAVADYSGVPQTVTFTGGGDTSMSFTFTAAHDTLDDDNEGVRLNFGSTLPAGITAGTPNTTTVTITDDDVPAVTVRFGAASYTVAESDDTGTAEVTENTVEVTVTLSADPERTVVIPIEATNLNGATAVADYSGVPQTITFNSGGDTSMSFIFSATTDDEDDDGESVRLNFGSGLPAGVTAGTPNTTTVTITDDDVPGVTVSFGAASYTVAESDDTETPNVAENTVEVTVTLSADPERTVVIPIEATNLNGATAVADYSGVPQTVTFTGGGDTSMSFTFTAAHDTLDDDGESVRLNFGSTLPAGITAGTPAQATVSITDDDDPSLTVQFGSASYTVAESDDTGTANVTENTVEVTVILSADPERTVVIPIEATNLNGATAVADYSSVPQTVTFTGGVTERSFTFTAAHDTLDDDNEGVRLSFGATLPAGITAGTPNQAMVSITDDDVPQVTVQFARSAYTVAEGASRIVTVTLSADPERTVIIPIEKTDQGGATNADYSGVPGSVTFNSGDTSMTFTVAAEADDVNDDGESVRLSFGASLPADVTAGTPGTSIVTITDDDAPAVTVQFGQSAYTVAEGGTQTVTVILSADPERTVIIPIETANQGGATNADYSGVPPSVTFTSGDTSMTFTLTAEADNVNDDGESVRLTFGSEPARGRNHRDAGRGDGEHHRRRCARGDGAVRPGRLHRGRGRHADNRGHPERRPGADGGHPHRDRQPGRGGRGRLLRRAGERHLHRRRHLQDLHPHRRG